VVQYLVFSSPGCGEVGEALLAGRGVEPSLHDMLRTPPACFAATSPASGEVGKPSGSWEISICPTA
jgi:hypothetical protein